MATNNLTRIKDNQVTEFSLSGNTLANNFSYGSNFTVTGNVTGGNIIVGGSGTVSSGGNVTGANIVTGGLITATGNIISTANVSGGNITTGGRVVATGNIVATANVSGGNLVTGGMVSATGNVIGGNVVTNSLVGTGLTLTSTGSLTLSPTANVVLTSGYITGLSDPVQNSDAANKGYVDSVAQGLDPKASVSYASAAALPAYTYNNGTSGVGATITATSNGALSLDTSSPAAGERVLIKNETGGDAPYNGIYTVTVAGNAGVAFVLTRATDMDSGSGTGEFPGAFTFVEYGTT